MAQRHRHNADTARQFSQIEPREQVALVDAPARLIRELTEAKLAGVVGSTGGTIIKIVVTS